MFFKNWKFFKAIKKGNIKEVTVFLETDPHLSKKSKLYIMQVKQVIWK